MSISTAQVSSLVSAVRLGLSALLRPPVQTAAEWMDEHYYLPVESSYQEGRWKSLPFQVAIINAMANDDIREVNFVKSARVGYTKMLLGVAAYLLEHKKRNGLIWQPTDGDAELFVKKHVEPMIRDVPKLRALAPWFGKKHRDNTLELKRFANGRGLEMRGGKAAKNYREASPDFGIYDELAAFDNDIEKEGSPTFLGDKRMEGSTHPKSIRGSTPKIAGQCQIERAASESPHFMRYHVKCPHCGGEQYLKWGGPDAEFGIKWDGADHHSAFYLCEVTGCVIRQHELDYERIERWICERTGIWTRDAIDWFDNQDQPIPPPESVTFHIWTAYSPFTTWVRIASDFLKAKDDQGKLKTFVNTTLGETWEDETGEKLEWEAIAARREVWPAPVPDGVLYITVGADTQDDRFEFEITGWGAGEESWVLDYQRLYGDLHRSEIWERLHEQFSRQFVKASGEVLDIGLVLIDSGGHYTDEVYQFCRRNLLKYIPIRGAPVMGKPIITFPRKRNRKGVYFSEVGTDAAKDVLYGRLGDVPTSLSGPSPGYRHHPVAEWADDFYFKGLTCERKRVEFVKGRRVYRWAPPSGARNEPTDCAVYALAGIRLGVQHRGWRLIAKPRPTTINPSPPGTVKPAASAAGNSWLGTSSGSGGWL
ncbi:phage terminase large subunit family protein [Aeromonas dhakensis]|uniref:phage terminase large subunit family protein n=1 Tax=Aeromonas dhakensis TaxID=196024 RepID=UPI001BFCBEE4|nr:terminase gpA endonuclease subunit [Aeromonas dhakensis]HDT5887719.1 phage terminase large subunit family protein [Aeromonas dhakensis]HEB4979188.1 phage terminase large subunit family protein [Aeromonas dhakensis]